MAKLDELWDPVPRRLIADLRTEKWTTERPASNVDAWVWAFRQIDEGAVPSVRDFCAFTGWGNRRAARMLDEVIAGWNEWTGKQAARQEQHHARKRIYSAPPPHLPRTSSAPPPHLPETVKVEIVEEERTYSAPPPHLPRTSSASTAHRRARSFLKQESDTRAQEQESGSPDLTDSPPPAEPSGTSERWTQAADIIEAGDLPLAQVETPAQPKAQPVSDGYKFADADPVGVPQPFDPIEEFTPSPPPSASPAARPRGLSGEDAPEPATAPQDAPSLSGRTDTAPEAQTPAKAPPRARKATAADKAADALAVYGAWRAYHPRAAETPTPGTLRALGSLLTEAGSRDDALLLIEWAHVGTCERARQIQGVAPWPDRKMKALWDLESLSRHVAGRLEMARSWKDGSTDKDSGLNVINLPPPTYRAPPNRTTRDIDFYKALELI